MDNTAQNQNPNGMQFAYPDFNNSPIQVTPTQVPQPQTNPVAPSSTPSQPSPVSTASVPKTEIKDSTSIYIDENKLNELKKDISALIDTPPAQESVVASPSQTAQSQTQPSATQEATYVQKPTELPNLQVPPIAKSNWNESLSQIMPELNKIKALERNEKENNLSKPLSTIMPHSEPLENENSRISLEGNEITMEKLFTEVVNKNASDLHISVGYPPIIRIDGELIDVGEKLMTPEEAEKLILSVIPDDKKELLEVNREIDFAYSFEGARTARFRVNAYYTMKNLAAAFRLIPTRVKTIEELLLPQIYHQIAKLKQGLVLVTGPTGHGKSTTLAAMLEDINRNRFDHIITIEDPIEYVFEGKKALIDQREMNDDTNSWAIALRSAMRQDPDVILVGEMRDYETIAAAITLAETGHLVFATLHTNNAAQTVDRVIDVFPENQQAQVRLQLSNILQVIVAQRLIPLDQGGRRAVSEILFNTPAVANLIREGKTHQIDNVIRTSADIGMVYLEKSLVSLVREGVITAQKAQEYAVHPDEVVRLLKG